MINNHNNNYGYASFNNNYANLRARENNNNKNKNKLSSSNTISHATRIEPTNLSYKDLLRKHQFTPQSGDSTPQSSPMKQEFDKQSALSTLSMSTMTPLELERESYRLKPIIEEPKKSVSGYQLFAKWKRKEKPEEIDHNYPQSKALSIAWSELTQIQKNEWNKQSEQGKLQYIQQKELWLKYVQDAKRLGIPVPTKSVKPMIQQIKIKNLLHLIPDICKFNKETQFIISKATEIFIQFYASKAIEIQQKTNPNPHSNDNHNHNNNNNNNIISSLHCFDALQTSHQFNFLRAVTVKPSIHRKTTKKRKRSTKKDTNHTSNELELATPKKKRRLHTPTDRNNEELTTNQIITNHVSAEHAQYPYTGYPSYISTGGYGTGAAAYYQHNGMNVNTVTPFSAIYQPPNPFTNYSPMNSGVNNPQTQIVNVQQIFGSDE